MKYEPSILRVNLENSQKRAVKEREELVARIAELDLEIDINNRLLRCLKEVTGNES